MTRCLPDARRVVARLLTPHDQINRARLLDIEHCSVAGYDTFFVHPKPDGPARQRLADLFALHAPSVRVYFSDSSYANGKVGQLKDFFSSLADDGMVLLLDADIDAASVDVEHMFTQLQDPSVAAVYAPSAPSGSAHSLGDFILDASLTAGLHAIPLMSKLDPKCFAGAVLAIRASALHDVGGWEAFADTLGEDIALAKALRQHCWQIRSASCVARATRRNQTIQQVWGRALRWVGILRAHRPEAALAYPVVMGMAPLLMAAAIILGLMHKLCTTATIILVVLAGIRIVFAFMAKASCGLRVHLAMLPFEVVLGDCFLLAVWLFGLRNRPIFWHGRRI